MYQLNKHASIYHIVAGKKPHEVPMKMAGGLGLQLMTHFLAVKDVEGLIFYLICARF